MRQEERSLQAEIMLRLACGHRRLIALPIPNGVFLPARNEAEQRLVCRLVARLKADGMLVPGAPDLALFWQGGGALLRARPRWRDLGAA